MYYILIMVKNLEKEKWRIIDSNQFIYRSNYGREKQRVGVRFEKGDIVFDDEIIINDNMEFINNMNLEFDGEIWREWGNHLVSNYGRVKYQGVVIYRPIDEKGYCNLGGEGLHRVVAKLYLDEPTNGRNEVDHINTIRHDNRASNLRWVTTKENLENPITNERLDKTPNFKRYVYQRKGLQ